MPQLSLGELEALVLKACRGVGYSWGLSQEAGRASVWLAVRGLPVSTAIASLLHKIDEVNSELPAPQLNNGAFSKSHHALCPIKTGTAIADFGWAHGKTIAPGSVDSPLILIPFVASCASSAANALRITLDEKEIDVSSCGEVSLKPEQCDFGQSALVVISEIVDISESRDTEATVVRSDSRRVMLSDARVMSRAIMRALD